MAVFLFFSLTFFCLLVCAIVSIFPDSGNFNVDNVRVCKILVSDIIHCIYFVSVCEFCLGAKCLWCFQGCGVTSSSMLHGMVFKKEAEGDITSVKDAKIAVYSCPFDCMMTETKVMNTADSLSCFRKI